MGRIFEDNSRSIGGTPLVQLRRIGDGAPARILAKIEGRSPAYSVKHRIGAAMIWDAEERGVLRPGVEVVEPTSGNTGIALAFVCASRSYRLTLTMPETMSLQRRKVLAAFGANLVLTPGAEGMTGAIRAAERIVAGDPEKFFMPQQFANPANPAIHERTTGRIWDGTTARSTCSCPASGPAAIHRRLALREGAEADRVGRSRAREEPGHHAGTRR
jgi:cysteine synthase A